jgi:hypothetical protein
MGARRRLSVVPVAMRVRVGAFFIALACILVCGVSSASAGYVYVPPPFGSISTSVGIAVDNSSGVSAGDVYVAELEGGATLHKFDAAGTELEKISGSGFSSGGGPWAVGVDAVTGDVYASIEDPAPGFVDKFDAEGHEVALPAGAFQPPEAEVGAMAKTYEPSGVAVDNSCYWLHLTEPACKAADPSNGDVYVADRNIANSVVYKFTAEGAYLGKLGGPSELAGAQGPGTITVDSNGDVYVANYTTVRGYDPSGNPLKFATENILDENGAQSVASDPSTGNIFVYQSSNGRIQEFNSAGDSLGEIAMPEPLDVYGLAVSASTHDVYVSNIGPGEVFMFEYGEPPATPITEAGEVVGHTAVLKGELRGGESAYYFTYNTGASCTGAGSKETPVIEEEAGIPVTGTKKVHAEVQTLAGATEYKFCIVAKDKFGPTFGGPMPVEVRGEAPTEVVTKSVSSVNTTSAQLNGAFNPGGGAEYYFEYGLEPCATAKTACTKTTVKGPVDSFTQQPAAETITGLQAGETYYYRLVATNSDAPVGGVRGNEETFIPESSIRTRTEEPEDVTETSAYLVGLLNPNGSATYYFEYGTTPCTETTCGTKTPQQGPVKGENWKVVKSADLTGLAPGTTYYYRVVATSGTGTAVAEEKKFTTAPAINLTTPPATITPAAGGSTTTTATLTSIPPSKTTPPPKKTTTKKVLSNAQKLANALKACRKEKKPSKRAGCERQVRKLYAPLGSTKSKHKKNGK